MRRDEANLALRGLLEAGRVCPVVVQGTSMDPFLKAGAQVHLEAIPPAGLVLGDLMAYLQGDALIVHRYLGRVDQGGVRFFRQKGDNLPGAGLVHPDALVGRVRWVERDGVRSDLLRGRQRVLARLRGLGARGRCGFSGLLRRLRRAR